LLVHLSVEIIIIIITRCSSKSDCKPDAPQITVSDPLTNNAEAYKHRTRYGQTFKQKHTPKRIRV
jgi:hypothetical protein